MKAEDYTAAAQRIVTELSGLERERLAFSAADVDGRVRLAERLRAAGLSVRVDDAANVFGLLEGRDPERRPLVVGSHLDTVSNPGRFDGALGVFGALECARFVAAAGARLRHPLLVSALADEEGTATDFCWGSRALLGRLSAAERSAIAGDGSPFSRRLEAAAAAFRRQGWDVAPARLLAPPGSAGFAPAAYLELHIEQGDALGPADPPVAVIRDIAGIEHLDVIFRGEAGHPATVAPGKRADAVLRAAAFIQDYWAEATALAPRMVATIGRLAAEPGDLNVVPALVRVSIEQRSADPQELTLVGSRLRQIAAAHGGEVVLLEASVPTTLDHHLRGLIVAAAQERGIACGEVTSWAGHDAEQFASVCPSAMLSVRNRGGASHSPRERADVADIAAGLELLLATLRRADQALD